MKRIKLFFLKKYFYLFASLAILIAINSCKKNSPSGQVPNSSVDVYIYVTDPLFVNIDPVGGWTYVAGGSRGILVYRKANSGTNTDFIAYDRHCPYLPENTCGLIEVDVSGTQAIDSCCVSKFLLNDGAVISGPSPYPLKIYQNTCDGSVLHIYN